ncbi:hypothetical protein B0H11DRAFT_2183285 [Mycena galericulata]|nr:hypothetical protein B0H11DRAFT_2183285 [Mycena galericulata]
MFKLQGCDGQRPICTPCRIRPPRTLMPCQYSRTVPTNRKNSLDSEDDTLEHNSQAIHSMAGDTTGQIHLSDPYLGKPMEQSYSPVIDSPPGGDKGSPVAEPGFLPTHNISLDVFLGRFSSSEVFFLDPAKFRLCILLPLPIGHHDRGSASLTSVVDLWGANLCSHAGEEEYLTRTLINLALEMSTVHPPNTTLQLIQAQILMSFYYFNSGNLLPGRHHCAAALSLAACAGITKLVPDTSMTTNPPFSLSSPHFPPPSNSIEYWEWTRAMWSIMVLNNYWIVASGLPSLVSSDLMDSWQLPSLESGDFLEYTDADRHSTFALLVEASVLLERVIALHAKSCDPSAFTVMDYQLQIFQSRIPKVPNTGEAITLNHNLLLTHCLTNVAILRLHAPYASGVADSTDRCFTAAGRFVDVLNTGLWQQPEPILGPLISTVGHFYICNISTAPTVESNLQVLFATVLSMAARSQLLENCSNAMREYHFQVTASHSF